MNEIRRTKHGLTLIELLIAISISTLLGAATVFMLRNSLDAYLYGEEQALIYKILDETLEEISGESFKEYGIKDALEILEARPDAISFLPLWVDDSHRPMGKREKFILNRRFSLGSSLPTLESRTNEREEFTSLPITFIPHQEKGKLQDLVIPNEPLATGAQARIVFQPDPKDSSDVIMRLSWDAKAGHILRTYRNKTETIPKSKFKGFKFSEVRFQYFDNTNTEIPAPVSDELLSVISAVRIDLELFSEGDSKRYRAYAFLSLRNSRAKGKGIVMREGMRMKIPDSQNIRTFSLGNITGVKKVTLFKF